MTHIDVTSPSDTFAPPQEPDNKDWLMNELQSILRQLENNVPYAYEDELDVAIVRLGKILDKARKPF